MPTGVKRKGQGEVVSGNGKKAKKIESIGSRIVIPEPNYKEAVFQIIGTSPYMQHKMSEKVIRQMETDQREGSTAKSKKKRSPKDFEALYEDATYRTKKGEFGIPSHAFRSGMIDCCRLVNFTMVLGRLSFWIEQDGWDIDGRTPLTFIHGEREMDISPARNSNASVDLRARPIWKEWSADVRIGWDADQFTISDITYLLMRCGKQAGIGEGRNSSKKSHGIGLGSFKVDIAEVER